MDNLTPQAIARELDKYIVGQDEAKKAMAVALRNRERRKKLPPEMRNEIMPKNIMMIGPTGVGKTEIARRLATTIRAPFTKIEATKYTEVGYVGRDVESIVRDLVEISIHQVYEKNLKEVESKAQRLATERIVNYCCQQLAKQGKRMAVESQQATGNMPRAMTKSGKPSASAKRRVAELLSDNQLDEQLIEIEVDNDLDEPTEEFPSRLSLEEIDESFGEFVHDFNDLPSRRRRRKVPVKEARRILTREEANKMLDIEQVIEEATKQAEENGVVFID